MPSELTLIERAFLVLTEAEGFLVALSDNLASSNPIRGDALRVVGKIVAVKGDLATELEERRNPRPSALPRPTKGVQLTLNDTDL